MKRARPSSAECGGCGAREPFLLFNVKLRTIYRHLCPSCVLKYHPNSFCPICLEVYDDASSSPSPSSSSVPSPSSSSSSSSSLRVGCAKCLCLTHTACVAPEALPSYHCPSCADPSFLFFRLTYDKPNLEKSTAVLDKDSAKALLAAAHIAHSSLAKAAAFVRSEADKRVKEAAIARKRAREAIERVQFIVSKERSKSLTKDSKPLYTPPQQPLSARTPSKMQMQTPIQVQSGFPEVGIVKKPTPASTAPIVAKDVQSHSVKVEESNGSHSVSPVMGQSAPQHRKTSH